MKRAGCILANFDFDQAEGLRRMLAGPQPRVMTFLSATPQDDKGAMLVNLGASLVYGGNGVLLLDASGGSDGVAARLGLAHSASLRDVARQQCGLNQVIHQVPQGFGVASLGARNHLMDSMDYAGEDELRRLGKRSKYWRARAASCWSMRRGRRGRLLPRALDGVRPISLCKCRPAPPRSRRR